MANKWCVTPETVKIDLVYDETPFWIQVKKRLNQGEKRYIETAGFRGMSGAGFTDKQAKPGRKADMTEISIDWQSQSFARTETYLTGWSLADDAGNVLPLLADKREALSALHPEVYDLIEKAINAHVERQAKERESPTGASSPSTTSV